MAETGWFVDQAHPKLDGFAMPEGTWIVGLQYPGGVAMFRDGPGFATEAEALDWILDHVIGQGVLPDE